MLSEEQKKVLFEKAEIRRREQEQLEQRIALSRGRGRRFSHARSIVRSWPWAEERQRASDDEEA